jgi:hypothetical protein
MKGIRILVISTHFYRILLLLWIPDMAEFGGVSLKSVSFFHAVKIIEVT